jgi:hypothetical protein
VAEPVVESTMHLAVQPELAGDQPALHLGAGLLDIADMVGAPGDQGLNDGQQGAAERGPL